MFTFRGLFTLRSPLQGHSSTGAAYRARRAAKARRESDRQLRQWRNQVKIKRHASVLGLIAASAIALAACGSDDNTAPPAGGGAPSSGGDDAPATTQVDCGGKKALKSSGSSAQANAMTRFVAAYEA